MTRHFAKKGGELSGGAAQFSSFFIPNAGVIASEAKQSMQSMHYNIFTKFAVEPDFICLCFY